jgi:hypothetical protein
METIQEVRMMLPGISIQLPQFVIGSDRIFLSTLLLGRSDSMDSLQFERYFMENENGL